MLNCCLFLQFMEKIRFQTNDKRTAKGGSRRKYRRVRKGRLMFLLMLSCGKSLIIMLINRYVCETFQGSNNPFWFSGLIGMLWLLCSFQLDEKSSWKVPFTIKAECVCLPLVVKGIEERSNGWKIWFFFELLNDMRYASLDEFHIGAKFEYMVTFLSSNPEMTKREYTTYGIKLCCFFFCCYFGFNWENAADFVLLDWRSNLWRASFW